LGGIGLVLFKGGKNRVDGLVGALSGLKRMLGRIQEVMLGESFGKTPGEDTVEEPGEERADGDGTDVVGVRDIGTFFGDRGDDVKLFCARDVPSVLAQVNDHGDEVT
jgi:hypothetical protein